MIRRLLYISLFMTGVAATLYWLYPVVNSSQAQDCQACVQRGGAIQGRVLDLQGQPIAGATVYAVNHKFAGGVIPTAETERDGSFSLIVAPGLHTVYSGKISAGYPEDLASIYQDAVRHLDVQVVADETVQGVELRVGPPLGKLRVEVIDVTTRQPIAEAKVTLRLADKPDIFSTSTADDKGRFAILAPPVPFTIHVTAHGFKDGTYGQDGLSRQSDALKVRGGEVKKVTIALRPASVPPVKGTK
jgi:hypothetical protein